MSRDIDLSRYTEEELIELNRRIVERIKLLRQARTFNDMARFELGDTVSFTPECGHVVVGTVVRLNKKTITVAAKPGEGAICETATKAANATVCPIGNAGGLRHRSGGQCDEGVGASGGRRSEGLHRPQRAEQLRTVEALFATVQRSWRLAVRPTRATLLDVHWRRPLSGDATC